MQFSKSNFHVIWLFLLYFLYIFNISFAPLPYFLRTRLLLGGLGILLAFFLTKPSDLSKSIIVLAGGFALLLIPSGLTSAINGVFDGWFIQYAAQQLFHLFGAYLLVVLSLRFVQDFDLDKLLKFIVYVVAVNNLMAVVMFFVPPLQELMLAMQNHDEITGSKLDEYIDMNFRFYGWGINTFFLGGLISGYTLILLAYLIRKERSGKRVLWLSALFLFIAVSGVFIARTTLVGAGIGAALILWPARWTYDLYLNTLKRNIYFVGILLVSVALGIALLTYIFPEAWDSQVIAHAFELFMNLDRGGELATYSTDDLQTMYVWPDYLRTWLIGDGKFNVPDGYYMGTDVGYLRMIYYFGVLGMIVFFAIQLFLTLRIHQFYRDNSISFLMLLTLAYVLALNLKALADVNAFLYLVLWLAVFGRVPNNSSSLNSQVSG